MVDFCDLGQNGSKSGEKRGSFSGGLVKEKTQKCTKFHQNSIKNGQKMVIFRYFSKTVKKRHFLVFKGIGLQHHFLYF